MQTCWSAVSAVVPVFAVRRTAEPAHSIVIEAVAVAATSRASAATSATSVATAQSQQIDVHQLRLHRVSRTGTKYTLANYQVIGSSRQRRKQRDTSRGRCTVIIHIQSVQPPLRMFVALPSRLCSYSLSLRCCAVTLSGLLRRCAVAMCRQHTAEPQ